MPTAATNPEDLTALPSLGHRAPAKLCVKCGEEKPLAAFQRRAERSDRHRGECKSCRQKPKTPAQVQQIAERRRARKEAGRTPRQQAAEGRIQDLIWARDRVPPGEEFDEWRAEINRAITRIRKSGKRTPDLAVKALTEALENPFNKNGATVADLSADTEVPEQQVLSILTGLISVGTVYRAPKEVPDIARGRTIWLYFLTGKKSRTEMVLP